MNHFTFSDYQAALEGVGPKLKENILERACNDSNIDFQQLKKLVDFAYPDQV